MSFKGNVELAFLCFSTQTVGERTVNKIKDIRDQEYVKGLTNVA